MRFLRLGLAAVGPASVAVAHFGQSMLLLSSLPAHQFGAFAFLLTLAALSWSVWNALFCAPLAYLVRHGPAGEEQEREAIIASASLYAALMVSPAFPLAALVLGLGAEATILFTGFAVLTLLRWIGRATAYLHGRAMSVLVSDLTYALLLAAALALVWLKGAVSLTASFAAMAAAALLALLPFGFRFAATIFRGVGKRPLRSFIEMARTRLPWSMLDVFCTEVTDHSHAYIVTLFAGTAGYAPLAATGQLVRPMTVVSNALSDMERPRFAQLRTEGRLADLYRSMRTMRIALALAWLAASSAVLALFVAGPYRLFPPSYDIEVLVVGASFWVLISGLAIARVPEGSHLQAVGSFRATAAAQLYGAITSVAAVILLLLVAGPVWSLAGTFLGRAVNAARLQAISRRWRRENAGPAAAPEAAIARAER